MATYRPLLDRTGLGPTTCPHGHAWTPDNTYVHPTGSLVCRTCNRDALLRHRRSVGVPERGWLRRLVLATLAAHPEGLRVDRLRAKIGYRASAHSLHRAVWTLRHRRGLPIDSVREGRRVRYVLRREVA
jgi:hypothetical protein